MKNFLFISLFITIIYSNELLDIKLLSSKENKIIVQVINSSDKIVTFNHISILKLKEGKEDIIREDINCFCNKKCKKKITILYQNEKKRFSWDKKDSKCNNVYGLFKFVAEKGDEFIGESKKIRILKK